MCVCFSAAGYYVEVVDCNIPMAAGYTGYLVQDLDEIVETEKIQSERFVERVSYLAVFIRAVVGEVQGKEGTAN